MLARDTIKCQILVPLECACGLTIMLTYKRRKDSKRIQYTVMSNIPRDRQVLLTIRNEIDRYLKEHPHIA